MSLNELASKLMTLKTREESDNLPSAIFGTAGQLGRSLDTRERVRVGMWPAISKEDPALAMGLMTALAFLLERWGDIRVYRLFAKVEGAAADFKWSHDQSQFDVEAWELEPLDENIGMWGSLEKKDIGWVFTIELENDLYEEEDTTTITREADSIAGLVNILPEIAEEIAEAVEGTGAIINVYKETSADDDKLKLLLAHLFEWQTYLFLGLWGYPWEGNAIEDAINALVDAGKAINDDFSAWAIANAVSHAMLPGYASLDSDIPLFALSVVERFAENSFSYIYISDALYQLGDVQRAFDLMEAEVKAHAENAASWIVLAGMYQTSGRYREALDTFQRAIENDAVNPRTYTRYAGLLDALDQATWSINEFVLIDPDEYDEDLPIWEAIEALEEALKLAPDRVSVLQQQLLLLADMGDAERLWPKFERLLDIDETGEAVRSVVDSLYNLEDIEPAIEALKKKITQEPHRHDLMVNLGAAYISAEEETLAVETLEKAEDMTDDIAAIADIQRLVLIADDPEFETRLAEINAAIDSGTKISADDAEFIETALEVAPTLSEGYVLLGKIYNGWDDTEEALDILMDGYEQLPEDPQVIGALAQILWDSDQNELAFDYLNKGIEANPNDVPLLALTGQFLFEDDQPENAKAYLSRAEAVNPRHPALRRARALIAEMISKR